MKFHPFRSAGAALLALAFTFLSLLMSAPFASASAPDFISDAPHAAALHQIDLQLECVVVQGEGPTFLTISASPDVLAQDVSGPAAHTVRFDVALERQLNGHTELKYSLVPAANTLTSPFIAQPLTQSID
ncbi:hypothetical protein ACFFUB_00570 [Algimonas porphyrae]|uniref:Uncharacterized protein n=1 Tax=Algimonas porphyrae TaxID=1128113 RepID=A0ABQ5V1L3_9PROT|nr:hypothetical protein [Algimonas porphyrae]GLQ20525.1 hypothetical protein GCM10007854_14800 [Algimonas porphyrae]